MVNRFIAAREILRSAECSHFVQVSGKVVQQGTGNERCRKSTRKHREPEKAGKERHPNHLRKISDDTGNYAVEAVKKGLKGARAGRGTETNYKTRLAGRGLSDIDFPWDAGLAQAVWLFFHRQFWK
jgi:hypothetical protein